MFEELILAYGGFDAIIVTAGVFMAPDAEGAASDDHWPISYAVNVTGSFLVADEAKGAWQAQGLFLEDYEKNQPQTNSLIQV